MTIGEMLQAIYDSEYNIELSWFWDGGFDICIGDHINGSGSSGNFTSLQDAVQWAYDNTVGKNK